MAITWPAKNNFATGDVLTATQMNNIGDDLNDLNTRVTAAGGFWKNPVLNSNFSVWQRGTSIALAASTGVSSSSYTADRWQTATGANQAITVSRQATSDTTNLPNIQYCLRYQRNSGQTGTGQLNFAQSFESVNSIPFAGKTVTLSFYARAGANYSAASSALPVALYSGTGTDQNVISGTYTGAVAVISQTATLTTTWQRFSYSGSVGATATELGLYFAFTPVGTAGVNDYYEITGVQLEIGSSATSYYPNGNTYQAELAACQRYYLTYGGSQIYEVGAQSGTSTSTTASVVFTTPPVTMRTAPTVTYSALSDWNVHLAGTANQVASSLVYSSTESSAGCFTLNIGHGINASFGSGKSVQLAANNTTAARLNFSAEL